MRAQHAIATPVFIFVVSILSSKQAWSTTYQLADTNFYKLEGQPHLVFGYKIKESASFNFLGCDGVRYTAAGDKLVPTPGGCGDSRGGGITVFFVEATNGHPVLHVVESTQPSLAGITTAVAADTLKDNLGKEVFTDVENSPIHRTGHLVTDDNRAIGRAVGVHF